MTVSHLSCAWLTATALCVEFEVDVLSVALVVISSLTVDSARLLLLPLQGRIMSIKVTAARALSPDDTVLLTKNIYIDAINLCEEGNNFLW